MPHDLTIRPVTRGDDEALWALLEPAFRAADTYAIEPDIGRDEALNYWTAPPNAAFLAHAAGAPLGTCYLRPNARGGGAHVANAGFVTAEAARGRGLARAMLRRVEGEARARGFLAMQFNFVVETNAAALHIWRSEGYAEVGRLPGAFRHPRQGHVDALVMFKPLEGRA
ncbi:N-acetyltransferase [Rhodovulum sp. 12E13]|uniref:GNAT family N-acetyltransferase n=1 Tax=Rhodovulum sp. 12E13 TaxID=2203891 RepID=UPI000E1A3C60|nr:GNAT family N-acetyltransferase [Rhodovulum sp. 12E13]RDC73797.1 N-acetyltransferase [Rhodovulum sp. 12E13]